MAKGTRSEADSKSAQEIIERAAEVTGILFRAPHPVYGYAVILLAPFVLVPLFLQLVPTPATITISAAAYAIGLIYVVPTVIFAAASHRLARLLGGTFNRRRAVFLAAVILLVQLVIVLIGGLLSQRGVLPFLDVLILAYSFVVMPYHVALFTTSDNRQIPTSIISLFHPIIGLVAIHYLVPTGPREIWLSALLPAMFLLTTVYFTEFVDVPVRRNTGLSLSEMFRHYLDHLRTGDVHAERLIDAIGGEIDAHVGAVVFRRPGGPVKCAIVVPAVHPGPIGHLGGSNLPAKVAGAVRETSNVLVPHGPATHDFNPTSSREVERVAEEARRLITNMEYSNRASPLIRRGTDAQVCSQVFGDSVLLTYTSWPKPIDDIDFGVGHAAMVSARAAGLKDAIFVDAHNSLTLGAGAVFPSTTRAWEIVQLAEDSSREARDRVSGNLRAGYAQDKRSFTRMEGVGEQGCQVIVTEVDGARTAYILWDGNNMVSDVRAKIRDAISDLVEEFEVMTTDNHSVNTVAGGYNPVGHRLEHEQLAAVARQTLEAAIQDLEPVEVGLKTSKIPGLRVLGHWTTMRLISSARTALSTIPRAATAMLVMQATMAALIIIAVGWFNPPVGGFRFPWP
jgi:putative membrane protein